MRSTKYEAIDYGHDLDMLIMSRKLGVSYHTRSGCKWKNNEITHIYLQKCNHFGTILGPLLIKERGNSSLENRFETASTYPSCVSRQICKHKACVLKCETLFSYTLLDTQVATQILLQALWEKCYILHDFKWDFQSKALNGNIILPLFNDDIHEQRDNTKQDVANNIDPCA